MNFTGHIENGAVVLDGNPVLPEGANVTVTIEPEPVRMIIVDGRPRIVGGPPGIINLTTERLHQLLEEEDFEYAGKMNAPS